MAQWTETLEPYIKVQEKIKSMPVNPTAGESLIIGCVLISDAGPGIPTLISSQSEFLSTYSSKDLTKDYIKSLNGLYDGDISDMAETMWLNAYRLAGSNTLLCVRASKAKDIFFSKALSKTDKTNTYLLRDGQLLKKISAPVKIVIDMDKDSAEHSSDGWSINISGIGILGNRTTDAGAQYDVYVDDLETLVDTLNESSMFFSPDYKFYSDERGSQLITTKSEYKNAVSVVFEELYIGANLIDTTDSRCPNGLAYVVTCEPDWTPANPSQKILDLNGTTFSGFDAPAFYASNSYNSSTPLRARIRRFNHDAVVTKELSAPDSYAGGQSPYTVLSSVLDTFTNGGTATPSEDNLYRDFYEIAILDPSVNGETVYFNVGNILGRGDMTVTEVNNLLNMISLTMPDDLTELGLGYYGYLPSTQTRGWALRKAEDLTSTQKENAITTDDDSNPLESKADLANIATPSVGNVAVVGKETAKYYKYIVTTVDETETAAWTEIENTGSLSVKYVEKSLQFLNAHIIAPAANEIAKIGEDVEGTYYEYVDGMTVSDLDPEEIFVNLSIDPTDCAILNVTDTDILKAFDQIALDEVYTTEGLADLGCTSPMVQSYMANLANNENYFYPISTINSTNYLAIGNSIARVSQDSYKLYASAPWDIDTGTVGWKYYVSPGTMYWETVGRNRRLGREFAPMLGQTNGLAQFQRPVAEFNKKTRQLLLTKKINTVKWDTQISAWTWNDNYTKYTSKDIMSDEANSRLWIRINKAIPLLLRQFIGRHIGPAVWADMTSVIDYWFKSTIIPMTYTINAYRITIDETNNTDEDARANRVNVLVEIRFNRALKYIKVYSNAFDMGMEFDGQV